LPAETADAVLAAMSAANYPGLGLPGRLSQIFQLREILKKANLDNMGKRQAQDECQRSNPVCKKNN
jgi:hypothetical protein